MGSAAEKVTYTYAEYLAAEEKSDTKHEWLNGEIFCMAGGTLEHARLAMGIGAELRKALEGKPCNVFSSDLRVKVQATGLSTYPDITVVCGKPETAPDDANAVVNPIVLVEVLSDATEGYDRGEKFAHYRRIPTLRDFVLVSQKVQRLEVFQRSGEGAWIMTEANPGESIRLESLGCSIPVDAVYQNPVAAEVGETIRPEEA